MSTMNHDQMSAVTGLLFFLNKHIAPNQGDIALRGWFDRNDPTAMSGAMGGIEFDSTNGVYVFNLGDECEHG